tara:strand:- start:155 stop:598 length:444 start_codon:yes stop_codon:yes gene_type:complete
MEHDLFIDGNIKEYTWTIKTGEKQVDQIREHPPAYMSGGKLDVKASEESKFIALHIGIYWGLGVFIIKDNDQVNVMCDSKSMYEIFTKGKTSDNQIINDKIRFINQLTELRKVKMNFQLIETRDNLSTKHLFADGKDTAGRDSFSFV